MHKEIHLENKVSTPKTESPAFQTPVVTAEMV